MIEPDISAREEYLGGDLTLLSASVGTMSIEGTGLRLEAARSINRFLGEVGRLRIADGLVLPPTYRPEQADLRDCMLDVVFHLGRFGFFWTAFAEEIVATAECNPTVSHTQTVIARMTDRRLPARRVFRSFDGDQFSDQPEHRSIRMRCVDDALVLTGELPSGQWVGRTLVWSGRVDRGHTLDWPANPDGRCASVARIPSPNLAGLYEINTVLIANWDVIILGTRAVL